MTWNVKKYGHITQQKVAKYLGVSSATVSRNWYSVPRKQNYFKAPQVPQTQNNQRKLFLPIKVEPIKSYKMEGVEVKEFEDAESLILQLADSIKKTEELKARLKKIF